MCLPWNHKWGPPNLVSWGFTYYRVQMCEKCWKIKKQQIASYLDGDDVMDLLQNILEDDEKDQTTGSNA